MQLDMINACLFSKALIRSSAEHQSQAICSRAPSQESPVDEPGWQKHTGTEESREQVRITNATLGGFCSPRSRCTAASDTRHAPVQYSTHMTALTHCTSVKDELAQYEQKNLHDGLIGW